MRDYEDPIALGCWPNPQVKTLADEVGVRFLSIGFDPRSGTEEVPIMPKARYNIMRAYMPTVGTLGLDMMLRSTTIQVWAHGTMLCIV